MATPRDEAAWKKRVEDTLADHAEDLDSLMETVSNMAKSLEPIVRDWNYRSERDQFVGRVVGRSRIVLAGMAAFLMLMLQAVAVYLALHPNIVSVRVHK